MRGRVRKARDATGTLQYINMIETAWQRTCTGMNASNCRVPDSEYNIVSPRLLIVVYFVSDSPVSECSLHFCEDDTLFPANMHASTWCD